MHNIGDLINELLKLHNVENNSLVNTAVSKEKFYELLLALVPGGLSIATDASCARIIHNPRAAQFLRINDFENFSHSALQPPPVKVFSNGKELVGDEMPMQKSAANNEYITGVELEFVWSDGVHKIAIWNTSPFYDDDSNIAGVIASFEEITKQKAMEKEISRLDRLNLIGQMAAGIAHEVRNPMTNVRGYLQLLGSKEEFSKYNRQFTLMIDELDRANSIITEYLSVTRDKIIALQMQNLNKMVENILPLIQSGATISDKYIYLELEEVSEIPLDEKEIRQLIFNLVQNGLQAMSSGGTMKIRTFIDKEEIVLAVQNDGEGITQEVLEKIGTPFFTTKENGTGLGLAVCYCIAARHNAKINIETGVEGTTFFVRFRK